MSSRITVSLQWKGEVDSPVGVATFTLADHAPLSIKCDTFSEANALYGLIAKACEMNYTEGRESLKLQVLSIPT